MNYLVLIRHGESRWNLEQRFSGWVDVPLTNKGIEEANACAEKLKNLEVDVAFTSNLERAHSTLSLVLAQQYYNGYFVHHEDEYHAHRYLPRDIDKEDIPIYSSTHLNERYYGDLQGIRKKLARERYGEEQVFEWRRSYNGVPPGGESLAQTYERVIPYFDKQIMDQVRMEKNVLVSAHGNTLRCVVKYIEGITEEKIPYLELNTGKVIIYKYENGFLNRISDDFTFDRPIEWGNGK